MKAALKLPFGLQAKYPNQLGGRQAIIRRADLGAAGTYYRALVGPLRPPKGRKVVVISEEAVSFDAFARLFRDALNCPNALFLDGGSASSLYAPTPNHPSNIVPLGPMLAVFEASRETPQQ